MVFGSTIGSDFRTAALANNIDTVRRLLDAGIDPDVPDSNGWTALMLTAKRGYPEVMELLLQKGAKVRQRNNFRKAALDYAIANHQPVCVDLLLKAGAIGNEVYFARKEVFGPFNIADYDEDYPMVAAVKAGDLETVNAFGKHFGGDTLGTRSGWQNIFNESLLLACRMNQYEMAKLLVSFGADVNMQSSVGVGPLLCAASHGNLPLIKFLLDSAADVNGAVSNGHTPLMESVAKKRGKAALFLIEKGANIHIRTTEGMSPLKFAEKHNMKRVIVALLKG
jgi:ankyrin repeat protein